MTDRLERNTRTVTVLTFGSRVTGLARDAVLGRAFGIGPVMDAFALAFMVPNLFRRLFGEGALSAAFLPVYARLRRSGGETAAHLASLLLGLMVLVLGAITVLGEMVLLAIGAVVGADHLGVRLLVVTLPYMPLVCIVAVVGAVLQVHNRFGPTAAAPVILNLSIIAATLLAPLVVSGISPDTHVTIVALSVVAAGLLQVTWSLAALRRAGVRLARPSGAVREPLREVLFQALPMILGLGVLQLNTFLDGLIASYPSLIGPTILGIEYPLDSGALATIGYAQRLYEFPLGVFGIAVATAIFPLLASQAHEPARFEETLRRGLRFVLYIGLPASAGLVLVSLPATAVILEGGDFTRDDSRRVAAVLCGYAPAIWAYSMNHVLTRALYALGDSRGPVRISLGMVVLNLLLNVTLIWTPLREAGLAWSTALCAVIQAAFLARRLRERSGARLGRTVIASWLRSLACTVIVIVALIALGFFVHVPTTWIGMALLLSGQIALGAAVYVAGSAALRMPELHWALGRSVQGR